MKLFINFVLINENLFLVVWEAFKDVLFQAIGEGWNFSGFLKPFFLLLMILAINAFHF